MNWKIASLLGLSVLLTVLYVRYFTDWFRPQPIQIFPQVRPMAGRAGAQPVAFMLDRKRRLTSVKVHSVSSLKTNHLAAPVWSLVSDSNSAPTKAILYGVTIEGMKPPSAYAKPQPLLPGVAYRLTIEEEGRVGTVDFSTYGHAEPATAVRPPPPPPVFK